MSQNKTQYITLTEKTMVNFAVNCPPDLFAAWLRKHWSEAIIETSTGTITTGLMHRERQPGPNGEMGISMDATRVSELDPELLAHYKQRHLELPEIRTVLLDVVFFHLIRSSSSPNEQLDVTIEFIPQLAEPVNGFLEFMADRWPTIRSTLAYSHKGSPREFQYTDQEAGRKARIRSDVAMPDEVSETTPLTAANIEEIARAVSNSLLAQLNVAAPTQPQQAEPASSTFEDSRLATKEDCEKVRNNALGRKSAFDENSWAWQEIRCKGKMYEETLKQWMKMRKDESRASLKQNEAMKTMKRAIKRIDQKLASLKTQQEREDML